MYVPEFMGVKPSEIFVICAFMYYAYLHVTLTVLYIPVAIGLYKLWCQIEEFRDFSSTDLVIGVLTSFIMQGISHALFESISIFILETIQKPSIWTIVEQIENPFIVFVRLCRLLLNYPRMLY